jgi:hypothetical protein
VYPGPWMLPKNHLKKFLFWRKASRTQKYLQKHGRKQKISQKQKLLIKTFAKTKIFRDIFRENGNFLRKPFREQKFVLKTFSQIEILRNLANRELFLILAKIKKRFSFKP